MVFATGQKRLKGVGLNKERLRRCTDYLKLLIPYQKEMGSIQTGAGRKTDFQDCQQKKRVGKPADNRKESPQRILNDDAQTKGKK